MNSKIKTLILIGAIALFTEVFRLVNSTRINLDNKNACVKTQFKKYRESKTITGYDEYTKKEARAIAYADCTFNN